MTTYNVKRIAAMLGPSCVPEALLRDTDLTVFRHVYVSAMAELNMWRAAAREGVLLDPATIKTDSVEAFPVYIGDGGDDWAVRCTARGIHVGAVHVGLFDSVVLVPPT